jgi:hypothetical protein
MPPGRQPRLYNDCVDNMYHQKHGPNTGTLLGAAALALVYFAALLFLHTLTGHSRWDGVIGIVLGLYISSHPAANLVNVLIFRHGAAYLGLSRTAYTWFWALNTLVMLTGLGVIFAGTLQFLIK